MNDYQACRAQSIDLKEYLEDMIELGKMQKARGGSGGLHLDDEWIFQIGRRMFYSYEELSRLRNKK